MEFILHKVLLFPLMRESNADNAQPNLLVMPNYDEPDFPLGVVGAFLGRFSNWTTTLLWGSKTLLGPTLQTVAQRRFQAGTQLVVAKALEVSHLLIASQSCVSSANRKRRAYMSQGHSMR